MTTDPYWAEVSSLLATLPTTGAAICLPAGDWGIEALAPSFYVAEAVVDEATRHDIVVVHKGMLGSFRQSDIRTLLARFSYIRGNPVFCVFARAGGAMAGDAEHLVPLQTYAAPRRLWRTDPRRCSFVHIPKTAGTSLWSAVASQVPASVYFSSDDALWAFDGEINDFEVVGGHIHADTLKEKGWMGDNFAILRDPKARILSFVAHAIRTAGYIGDQPVSFHSARDEPGEILSAGQREMLFYEANIQTAILGRTRDEALSVPRDLCRTLGAALGKLDSPRWSFGFQSRMEEAVETARQRFGLDTLALERLNTTAGKDRLVAGWPDVIDRYLADATTLSCDVPLYQLMSHAHGA